MKLRRIIGTTLFYLLVVFIVVYTATTKLNPSL